MPKITPFLWFDKQAEEAARFYVSVFPNSRVTSSNPQVTAFQLDGTEFLALNGGPQYTFNPSVSFVIHCETQEEIDRYWSQLTAGGGREVECGWLTDRYGLSWQVVPAVLPKLLGKDAETSKRVMDRLLSMKKLEIQPLVDAYEGR